MKGGVRLTSHNNTLNEGWCETLHHITIHSMKGSVRLYITKQYAQCRVVWDFTSQSNTLNEGWCETFTSHNNTLNEGRCETLHHKAIRSLQGGVRRYITQQYTQWRVVWDFTSHNNTLNEGWCETLHHEAIVWDIMLQNALWWLHERCTGAFLGEEAGAPNRVFFRVMWLQPAMKGTSCVRRVRLGSFHAQIGSSSVFCNECSCVRSPMRLLNLWWRIALEWLHYCCDLVLTCAKIHVG